MTKKKIAVVIFAVVLVIAGALALRGCNKDDHTNTEPTETTTTPVVECVHEFETRNETCVAAGCAVNIKVCSKCGYEEVDSVTEHSYEVSDPYVLYKDGKATGYAMTYTCVNCGYTYDKLLSEEEIKTYGLVPVEDIHDHVWHTAETEVALEDYEKYLLDNEKTDEVPVADGYISRYFKVTRNCEICDITETVVERRDEPAPTEITDEPSETDIPTPVEGDKECEHVYEAKVTNPTCKNKGYTEYTCTKCGKSYTADYKEALGHSYGEWKTVKNASCGVEGSKERVCSRCGAKETMAITALAHNYGEWTVTKAATCGAAGTKTRTCKNCGKTETQSIAKLTHEYGNWTTTRAATCDVNGEQARTCKHCGAKETKAIAATGHKWDKGVVTSTGGGCSGGIKTYTCEVCGKTKTEKVAGNHDFGEWVYVEHPWSKTDMFGKTKNYMGHDKQRTCKKCGFVEKKVFEEHRCDVSYSDPHGNEIPGLHTVTLGTCVTHGEEVVICKECGFVTHRDLGLDSTTHVHTKTEKRHVCDYDYWHDGIDAVITTCQDCGDVTIKYTEDDRFPDLPSILFVAGGSKIENANLSGNELYMWCIEHPDEQVVCRDFVIENGMIVGHNLCWTNADGTHHKEYIDLTLGWEGFIRKYARPESVDYYLGIGKGKISINIYGDRVYVSSVSW